MQKLRVTALAALLLAAATAAHAELRISSSPTANVTCSAGVCTATGKSAVLNVGDLETLLAASDIEVTTGSKIAGISVNAVLSWTSAHVLTLTTTGAITIAKPVSVTGTGGGLVLSSPPLLTGHGRVTFWDKSSLLQIGETAYTLVASVHDLAKAVSAEKPAIALARNYDATPDGTYATYPAQILVGVFDGLGNTISNVTINDPNPDENGVGFFLGLYKSSSSSALIRNFTLDNISVSAAPAIQGVGGLVALNEATLINVHVTGSVSGGSRTGGIAGKSWGSISQSDSNVAISVSTAYAAGGIAGENVGVIENSSSSGAVGANAETSGGIAGVNDGAALILFSHSSSTMTAAGGAGGLVGFNQGSVISSYATGSITNASMGAGLVGENEGLIMQSFATGSVTNGDQSSGGGLVGSNNGGTVQQSYARGDVIGGQKSGGFVAYNSGKIAEAYSTGQVSAGGSNGGFIGFDDVHARKIKTSYWDTDTGGAKGEGGGKNVKNLVGLTTAQFQAGLPDGFDPAAWGQSPAINGGFPYLLALPPK